VYALTIMGPNSKSASQRPVLPGLYFLAVLPRNPCGITLEMPAEDF